MKKPTIQIIDKKPFEYTLSIIAGKWKMKIIYLLICCDIARYGEIKRSITGITHKMLSAQLKELEQDGIINRKEFPQIPPKVEYSLTAKGKSLKQLISDICQWGIEHDH
nr:helix-turn-helix domain-containing protein [Orbus hercynius]